MPLVNGPLDWDDIDLVVFDMDGTLYDQRKLQILMAMRVAAATAASRRLDLVRILHSFRQCREELADDSDDFLERQYEVTASRCGIAVDEVRKRVTEWMEHRPLTSIARCRSSGIERLFAALSGAGKVTAVFSDYPAEAKLRTLGLRADHVISATDDDVMRLKPDPAGLRKLLAITGVSPRRSLMIGDRVERDWAAATRAGMRALIRSKRSYEGVDTFRTYADVAFQPLLQASRKEAGVTTYA